MEGNIQNIMTWKQIMVWKWHISCADINHRLENLNFETRLYACFVLYLKASDMFTDDT